MTALRKDVEVIQTMKRNLEGHFHLNREGQRAHGDQGARDGLGNPFVNKDR